MKLTQRFLALDIFRGMTICLMIIVNSPGSWSANYAPLQHAIWNGFTPTDLVFPSFLFAVGNALSFVSTKWNNMQESKVLWKIFKRTFLIFLIGYLLAWFPFFKPDENFNWLAVPIENTRILGVLQRIALCYGIAALMVYYLKPKTNIIISLVFLFGYWFLYIFYGNYDMHQNPVLDLDLKIFGEKHLYQGEGFPFDPEGLLSTIPSIVNVIAGYFAGIYIQKKGKTYEGLSKLLLVGFAFLTIGYLWHFGFPINKKIWTSSFVLITVGIAILILASIIYYVDFMNQKKGTYFFEVFGKNPLALYVLAHLFIVFLYSVPVGKTNLWGWTYTNVFQHFGDYLGSFFMAISFMFICWIVGYVMDKKKIYIKL